MKGKVVAVMPACNEEKNIGPVLDDLKNYADATIVVNDASTDKTKEIAESKGAIVIDHKERMGVGCAYKESCQKAIELGAEIIVIIHSDGQHDPDEIPGIIRPIQQGKADYVMASRTINRSKYMPKYRIMGNVFISLIWSVALTQYFSDVLTGYHAIRASTFKKMKPETWRNDFMGETDMLVDVFRVGGRIVDVPCKYMPQEYSFVNPLKDAARFSIAALNAMYKRIIGEI